MNLAEKVSGFDGYFDDWDAKEQVIDEKKAFYEIRKPGSEYRKVCMFRDGKDMVIYGDYGQYVFDEMTWFGAPGNLPYDNLPYLMEKMDHNSKHSVMKYEEEACEKDICEWLRNRLESRYDVSDEGIKEIVSLFEDGDWIMDSDIEELTEKYGDELCDILCFAKEALENTDEYEWVAFLRREYDTLQEFEEACESDLWNAGKSVDDRFYISLYAMQVCGEKLEKEMQMEKPREM